VQEISCTTYVVYGCIDPDAFNFNDEAQEDDGSWKWMVLELMIMLLF